MYWRLAYTNAFSRRSTDCVGWLEQETTTHKTKFETDHKNCLDDLAWKCKAEENEKKDAAKHRQVVENASVQLVEAFKHTITPPTYPDNVYAIMEEKMAAMKTDIMQEIIIKMEESSRGK